MGFIKIMIIQAINIEEPEKTKNIKESENFKKDAKKLKKLLLSEIHELESKLEEDPKTTYKNLHFLSVQDRLKKDQNWIEKNFCKYSDYFADGREIKPELIQPKLIEVKDKWQSDLFRLARYTWSLPYSSGYGRRIRFIVIDQYNGKLVGIIGLQSPPIDFKIRDNLFDYPSDSKVILVNQLMDIFTLGAIPPYNILLGGKLVALASTSKEVHQIYRRKYNGRITHMEQQVIPANLVALTTTSAFGRSSIYNRLKYEDRLVAQPIGYTKGFGSFHMARIYPEIKDFLKKYDEFKGGYGSGPRSVWANCRKAFQLVGISQNLLEHGVQREVFIFPLIKNLTEYMSGQETTPDYYGVTFQSLANWWKDRWLYKRAKRVSDWKDWNSQQVAQQIMVQGSEDG